MTKYAFFDGKKVAYATIGQGLPLVFVHGFCEDRSIWSSFITPFIENHQVVTIDIGGFGESQTPETASIATMAEQVFVVLEQEKNIEMYFYMLHSMGGYAAMAFAEKYADYLEGVVMFHTHPFEDVAEKKTVRDKGVQFIKTYGVSHFVTPLIPKLFGDAKRETLKRDHQATH